MTVEGEESAVNEGGEEVSVSDYADDFSAADGSITRTAAAAGLPVPSSEVPATGNAEHSIALATREEGAGGQQEQVSENSDTRPDTTALLSEGAGGSDESGVSGGDVQVDDNPTPTTHSSTTVSPRQQSRDDTETSVNGSAENVDASAISSRGAREFEERPHAAEPDNSRQKVTMEEDTGGTVGATGGVNKELEMLKSQVEAAR